MSLDVTNGCRECSELLQSSRRSWRTGKGQTKVARRRRTQVLQTLVQVLTNDGRCSTSFDVTCVSTCPLATRVYLSCELTTINHDVIESNTRVRFRRPPLDSYSSCHICYIPLRRLYAGLHLEDVILRRNQGHDSTPSWFTTPWFTRR